MCIHVHVQVYAIDKKEESKARPEQYNFIESLELPGWDLNPRPPGF